MAIPDWMTMSWLDKHRDSGLLLMRVGAGIVIVLTGWPLFAGGESAWTGAGTRMAALGVVAAPMAFGLAFAIIHVLGGAMLVLGLLTRFAATANLLVMIIALVWHFHHGHGVDNWSPVALAGCLFIGLMVMGPGRYSLDARNATEIPDH